MGRIWYKEEPDIHSPICHNTVENYMLYYGVSRDAYKYRLKHKKLIPMYMPVYVKWQLVKYKKIIIDSYDILYWLDMNWQIDLAAVVKSNPVIWIWRPPTGESKSLKFAKEQLRKRLERDEKRRSWE